MIRSAVRVIRRKPVEPPAGGDAYIIGGVTDGGSHKFITDLLSCFPHLQQIRTRKTLLTTSFPPNCLLYVQHLFKCDISVADVLAVSKKCRVCIVINVHDWSWLSTSQVHSVYLSGDVHISPDVRTLFQIAHAVIYPTSFMQTHFERYLSSRGVVSPHIDLEVRIPERATGPTIENRCINIGFMSEFIESKGKQVMEALMRVRKSFDGHTINYLLAGRTIPRYKEQDFHKVVTDNKMHGLLVLNKWAESYGYALTKCLNTGLPILYNSFGAIGERVPPDSRYFKVCDDERQYGNIAHADAVFCRFLKYIIHMERPFPIEPFPAVCIPPLYSFLNTDTYVPDIWSRIHERVKPYVLDTYIEDRGFYGVATPDIVESTTVCTDGSDMFELVDKLSTPCCILVKYDPRHYETFKRGCIKLLHS